MSMRLMIGCVQMLPQPGICTTVSISFTSRPWTSATGTGAWAKAAPVRLEQLEFAQSASASCAAAAAVSTLSLSCAGLQWPVPACSAGTAWSNSFQLKSLDVLRPDALSIGSPSRLASATSAACSNCHVVARCAMLAARRRRMLAGRCMVRIVDELGTLVGRRHRYPTSERLFDQPTGYRRSAARRLDTRSSRLGQNSCGRRLTMVSIMSGGDGIGGRLGPAGLADDQFDLGEATQHGVAGLQVVGRPSVIDARGIVTGMSRMVPSSSGGMNSRPSGVMRELATSATTSRQPSIDRHEPARATR